MKVLAAFINQTVKERLPLARKVFIDSIKHEKSCRRQKLAEREEFTKSKTSSSLLSEDSSDLAGVRYRPKTRETKSTYEVLLSFIQAAIGDQVLTDHSVKVLIIIIIIQNLLLRE